MGWLSLTGQGNLSGHALASKRTFVRADASQFLFAMTSTRLDVIGRLISLEPMTITSDRIARTGLRIQRETLPVKYLGILSSS